jgi:dihydroorotate dehydrogenase (fumarate)
MIDLTTKYMGLTLPSPLIASSSPLTGDVDAIKRMVDVGIGAVTLPSLFEEQLTLRQTGMAYYLKHNREVLPESLRHIPDMVGYNRDVNGYLAHINQLKDEISIPVIASLNGSSTGGWIQYARILEAAGADALELNVYYMPTEAHIKGLEIEHRYLELVSDVCDSVKIPVAIKLSPYFSAIANIAYEFEQAGADALVLFNRFYQPDFDLDEEAVVPSLDLSTPAELRLRLRWVAILRDQIRIDLGVTGGIHGGRDVAKALVAGARVAMTTSALLREGVEKGGVILDELRAWMESKGLESTDAVRRWGLQRTMAGNRAALERANYLQVLQSHRPAADH